MMRAAVKSIRGGLVASAFAAVAFAGRAATIAVDNVQQRWPWNNKVDVAYTIAGDDLDGKVGKVMLTTVVNGASYTVYDGPVGEIKPGTFTVTWDNPPAGVRRDDCKMYASLHMLPVREGNDYMIVKLLDGTVTYEGLFTDDDVLGGLRGQELSNARYNVDKYKTTHLVLRKIPKGTYTTGDGGTTTWVTDRDFYIAVFPVTNNQYIRFIYPQDSTDNLRPRYLTYDIDVRGTKDPSAPVQMMSGKFPILAYLNEKTGMQFDLATKNMHEVACRAGTTTKYYWGTDGSQATCSLYAVCEYSKHSNANMQPVGSRLPNAWGLYDMVGNAWQLCRDAANGTYPEGNEDLFAFATVSGTPTGYVVRGNDTAGKTNVGSSTASTTSLAAVRIAYIVPNSGE